VGLDLHDPGVGLHGGDRVVDREARAVIQRKPKIKPGMPGFFYLIVNPSTSSRRILGGPAVTHAESNGPAALRRHRASGVWIPAFAGTTG
jgi:hypothetical protein